MLNINEKFEDAEARKLRPLKGDLSWHDFIMLMAEHCSDSKKKGNFEVYKQCKYLKEKISLKGGSNI